MTDDNLDELLTLTSRPPEDLLARVRARRAAGERVLLPTVPAEATPANPVAPAALSVFVTAPRRAGRSWRWATLPAGLAAAALLVVVGQHRTGEPGTASPSTVPSAPSTPPARPDPVAGQAPAPVPPAETPTRAAAPPSTPGTNPPTRSTPAGTRPPAPDRTRSAPFVAPPAAPPREVPAERPGTAVGGEAATAGARFTMRSRDGGFALALPGGGGAPDGAQRPMLDSLARVLERDPGRRAVVRYVDPAFTHESASRRLAARVADYLVARGVAPERVTLARVSAVAAAGGDAVEVVVAP